MQETPEKQIDKFKQAARELGADGDEETLDRMLRKIGRNPPLSKDHIEAIVSQSIKHTLRLIDRRLSGSRD